MKAQILNSLKFPSLILITLICLTVVEVHFNLIRWSNKSVIKWDVAGYYSYLPALIINNDITFKNDNAQKSYSYITNEKGQNVIKYPIGMAILYAPFFFSAHCIAIIFSLEANGFSEIYQAFIEFSGLFYLLFGLLYLRKTLLLFFNEKITTLSILFIYFGTNLLCYSTIDSAMSHQYSFSLFSIFIYYTLIYYQNFKLKYIILLAIVFGLIILIRPINLIFILFPILIGINNYSFYKRIKHLIIEKKWHLSTFITIVFCIVSVQLLYWKQATGNYVYFSYTDEGFFFSNPQIFNCLFSFRKGWFTYSPIIIFSIIGIYFLRKPKSNVFFLPIISILIIYFYVVASWWCWWYGGSYSQRAMIDLYPLLAISFASLLIKLNTCHKKLKITVYCVLTLLVLINIMQTYQYKRFVIHYDSMTAKAYLNAIGKINSNQTDTSLLQHPNYTKALNGFE